MKDFLGNGVGPGDFVVFDAGGSKNLHVGYVLQVTEPYRPGDSTEVAVVRASTSAYNGHVHVSKSRLQRGQRVVRYAPERMSAEHLQKLLEHSPATFPVEYAEASGGYEARFRCCRELVGYGADQTEARHQLLAAYHVQAQLGSSVTFHT